MSLSVADPLSPARRAPLARLADRGVRGPASALGAGLCLLGIAAVAVAVYADLASAQPGPFVFLDELAYERMADSFAHTGQIALLGKVGLSYSPLYSIVISPIYALTSSAIDAYDWVKTANVVMMALAVFPIYGIARFVLSRRLSLVVAAMAMVAPPMLYADLVMSESLAYPLTLAALWAMLRAVRDPRAANDLVLVVLVALASAARLQQVALVPASLTALVLVALLVPEGRRSRAVGRALAQHWVLVGASALAAVVVLAERASNGGSLPLSGRYSNVGLAHPSLVRTAKLFVEHLAELDFAVGVVPLAASVLGLIALRRLGLPRAQVVYATVAVSVTCWLLLEVAWDAAAFDATTVVTGSADIPRLHERYLIYLVPLFLVALIATLRVRSRLPLWAYVAGALVAAILPAAIPFGLVVNNSIVADSFAMELFAKAGEVYVPIAHAKLTAVALAALLASTLVIAAWRPQRRRLLTALPAVAATILAFVLVSRLVTERFSPAAKGAVSAGVPGRRDWVDHAVGHRPVVLVSGGQGALAGLETAFFNLSVDRVYHVCGPVFGADFGEDAAAVDPGTGALVDSEGGGGTIVAPYAIVPKAFGVPGQQLADDGAAGLVLVAPSTQTLVIPEGARASLC